MFTYYIAGVPNRPDFGHVKLIVEKLKRSLPRFSYRIIAKTEDEYQDWLRTFCRRQKWKVDKNPMVWKRAATASNGRCRLIGGINEFFELLAEYYGVDTGLDRRTKKLIASDNAERMSLMSIGRTSRPPGRKPRTVCITGAVYPQTGYLVSELMQLDRSRAAAGVAVRLHHSDVNKRDDLIKIKNETTDVAVYGYGAVAVVNSVEEGLSDCDLLIVIGTLKRGRDEDGRVWTDRNYDAMRLLASALNRHCPRRCRVLLTGMDLLCFNLSVLAEHADNVHLYNVVGVTGHLGMETLPAISRSTGVPISGLHCPPVWGFVGSQTYVDVDRVVYGHRRGPADGGGQKDSDKYLRTVLLLRSAGGDLADVVNGGETDDNKSVKTDCPLSCLPEIRATVRLLTEWFKEDSRTTISAAVFSDGTFGLPFGMFMSQPVCLENDEWKPNYDFPSPDEKILKEIVTKVKDITIKYNLGNRFKIYNRELMLQTSK